MLDQVQRQSAPSARISQLTLLSVPDASGRPRLKERRVLGRWAGAATANVKKKKLGLASPQELLIFDRNIDGAAEH
jgi:hypothetical protein